MIALTKGMIGLSALIATGFVSVESLTDARPQPTPISVISQRFVFAVPAPTSPGVDLTDARRDAAAALTAITAPHAAKKGDRLDIEARACADQTWPDLSADCLTSPDGSPVRRPARFVTVERHSAPNTSDLVRIELTDLASR
jgi:hypothetical protein